MYTPRDNLYKNWNLEIPCIPTEICTTFANRLVHVDVTDRPVGRYKLFKSTQVN